MMKLSTMKKVVDTVDSGWRSPLAESILERWGYDKGSVFYLRASANFIFIFKKDGKTYYLRFNDSCERDLSSVETELNIVQYLGKSIDVALPVKSLNQKYVEIVETEIGTFYAVVFEALEGKQYEIDEITDEKAYLWGKTLGKLHVRLKDLQDEAYIDRPSWRDHLLKVKEILPSHETAANREWECITKWAERLRVTKENFGLVHYDFELDNLVFKNFIEGYKTETAIDPEILKEISEFEKMHKLVSFAKLIRAVDLEESQEYPEWLTNLRKKLCSVIDGYRLSFEEDYLTR